MADKYEDDVSGSPVVLPAMGNVSYASPGSQGLGTLSNVALNARQMLEFLHISGGFQVGTTTGANARLNLPAGCTVGTWGGMAGTIVVGKFTRKKATATSIKQGTIFGVSGNTYVSFSYDDYTNSNDPTAEGLGNALFANSDIIVIDAELTIPIAEYQALGSYRAYGAGVQTSLKAGLSPPSGTWNALTVTSSITGWATIRAMGQYYQDANGIHRMRFNINGSFTSTTLNGGTSVTISGTTFKNVTNFEQACAAFNNGTSPNSYAYCNPNTSNIAVSAISSSSAGRLGISGDVELDSRPTWA